MKASPRVSVVMPVYNSEPYLRAAVESIINQTFSQWELIAVDDSSPDGSLAILHEYAARDSRIRVLSRANTGIVGALNDGIALARANYIARMDGDDVSLPERLERQVAYLDAHPKCVLLGTHVLRVDPAGLPIGPETQPLDHAGILARLLEGFAGTLTHPSVVIRCSALAAVGGYREQYQWVEDFDLFLRLRALLPRGVPVQSVEAHP